MDVYYKQPKYFDRFKCIGGKCPESCCDGWSIHWVTREVEKIKNENTDNELSERINNRFKETDNENLFCISLCEDGRCPFHNRESDLCDIQKSLGEEYLGMVCRSYPRKYTGNGACVLRSCNNSCPAVLELLLKDRRAMQLESTIARDIRTLDDEIVLIDNYKRIKENPVLEYRFEIFDFIYDILSNVKFSLPTSIILGAFGAKHISDAAEKGNCKKIPEIIKNLKPQLSDSATAKKIDEIKPNYQLKFKLVNNMIVKHLSGREKHVDISLLHDGKELIVDNYIKGAENFNKAFSDNEFFICNIILNLFMEIRSPFFMEERSVDENYRYFVMCAAVIYTLAAATGYKNEDIKNDFILSVSEFSRSLAHSSIRANEVIDEMNSLGLTTPAHLALIIR